MAERKILDIENGTVVDHIPAGKSMEVIKVISPKGSVFFIGMNVDSKMMGKKDFIKMENRYLSPDDLKKVAAIAPAATINTIKGFKVAEKKQVK